MTDYDINDDDLPTFSPRDVMRRLKALENELEEIRGWCGPLAPTPAPVPAPGDDELDRLATNLLRLSLDGVSLTGNQAAALAYQIIAEGIEFCQCAAPADRVVCEVTDELVDECVDLMAYASNAAVRKILTHAAAYWSAGAEAEGDDAQ